MGKTERVIAVITRWCGASPTKGSDSLQDLWEANGPRGVPFDDEGAELLIRELDAAFPGHRLRPTDVLGLTVDGLVDAIPDRLAGPAAARPSVASLTEASAPMSADVVPATAAPIQVELTDDTIERLARRIAALIAPPKPAAKKRTRKAR